MKIELDITKALVVLDQYGPDTIVLYTTLPPTMKNLTNQSLMVKFDCEANSGEEYLKKNFPDIPYSTLHI